MGLNSLRTTVVGSYPVPDWLKAHPQAATLQDAVALVLRAQEQAGVDVVSDGELTRWDLSRNAPSGMVERFVYPLAGIQTYATSRQQDAYRNQRGASYRIRPPGVVVGAVSEGELDLLGEWLVARELTARPIKFTVTSPYMMARLLIDNHYRKLESLAMALAEVFADQLRSIPCAILQVDEPHLVGVPQDAALAAEVINRLLDGSMAEEKAVHLCFGNYSGQTIQRGHYGQLIEFINQLHCDHVVLETTRRPLDELQMLTDVASPMQFGIGVIDVKDLQVESPDLVAVRIERLADILGERRLRYVNPDCGLQHLSRYVADGKLRAMVQGVRIFEGKAKYDVAMH